MPAPIIPGPQAKLVELAQGLIHPVWYAWLQGWQKIFDAFEKTTNSRLSSLEILAPIAWAKWNAAATVGTMRGCNVARNGVGDWTVTMIATPLTGTLGGIVTGGRAAVPLIYSCSAITAGTFRVSSMTPAGVATDPTTADIVSAAFFGAY